MPTAPTRPTFRLTIRPEPGAVSEYPRLKALLKRLLRGYGWRCISLEELPPEPLASPTPRQYPPNDTPAA